MLISVTVTQQRLLIAILSKDIAQLEALLDRYSDTTGAGFERETEKELTYRKELMTCIESPAEQPFGRVKAAEGVPSTASEPDKNV